MQDGGGGGLEVVDRRVRLADALRDGPAAPCIPLILWDPETNHRAPATLDHDSHGPRKLMHGGLVRASPAWLAALTETRLSPSQLQPTSV